jgi:hypothetical protein
LGKLLYPSLSPLIMAIDVQRTRRETPGFENVLAY